MGIYLSLYSPNISMLRQYETLLGEDHSQVRNLQNNSNLTLKEEFYTATQAAMLEIETLQEIFSTLIILLLLRRTS